MHSSVVLVNQKLTKTTLAMAKPVELWPRVGGLKQRRGTAMTTKLAPRRSLVVFAAEAGQVPAAVRSGRDLCPHAERSID
jgi:hypothetical protein